MLKTVDKNQLRNKHYKDFSKLAFRKKYNSFYAPKIDIAQEIIEKIKKSPAKTVLDVGCGNGDLLISLRKSGFTGKLFGIDISEGLLEEAKKCNEAENLNIRFEVMDAENLKFKDNCFDAIIAKHMLYHLPHVRKGINEIYRCLKPKGLFIITLNSEKNMPQLFKCEKLICKKYGLHAEHGQQLVSVENIGKYLSKFSNIETLLRKGKMKKPGLFAKYFYTFKDNYDPEPGAATWKKILKDVKKFVKEEIKNKEKFVETRVVGLMQATK
jgi:ubiquinone/menaquinone biosynthesis C-methylase UbiE